MDNETKNLFEFGDFKFDSKNNTLWRDNEFVSLPPKSLILLKLLIEKNGEVASKQEIFDKVWAETFVEEGVLTQNIYTLRQALGTDENGKQLIENLARRGYRLTVPIYSKSVEEPTLKAAIEEIAPIKDSAPASSTTRFRFAGGMAILSAFIAIAAFFGYRYFSTQTAETGAKGIGDLKFEQLTDTGDASYLTISNNGNWAAYTRGYDINLRNLQNSDETKINLQPPQKIGCLQFSADGEIVYFGTISNRDEKGSIYTIAANGGTPESAAENVWSGFSISPNGKELAFVRKLPAENRQVLIVKNLETKVEKIRKSLTLPEEFYWNNYPAWSADGKKIAMVIVNQTEHFSRILSIDDNGAEEETKSAQFRNVEQIAWTADGSSFIAAANDGKNFQLWKISRNGEARRITNDLNSYLGIAVSGNRKKLVSRQRVYFSNIWTAKSGDLNNLRQLTTGTSRNDGLRGLTWLDEEKIVYTSNDEKIRDWNIWLINAADGSKRRLTYDSETQNDYPVVSPDKKSIYLSSDRNKQSRIWRINTDGSNPLQITFGEDETHHFPQVSPDGKWLYFIIKSGRSSTIGRKSLEQNSVQELTGKTTYAPGNFLTISPDGKFLAFQNIDSNTAGPRLQIALLSGENPEAVELKEFNTSQQRIQWSLDGKFFEYVSGDIKRSSIVRQSTENESNISKLLEVNETIFNFAWSQSGENLAIARGQLLRDVILLTNFD